MHMSGEQNLPYSEAAVFACLGVALMHLSRDHVLVVPTDLLPEFYEEASKLSNMFRLKAEGHKIGEVVQRGIIVHSNVVSRRLYAIVRPAEEERQLCSIAW